MREPISDDRLAVVRREGHPAAGRPWSIDDYGRFHHVGVSLLGDGRSELDTMLAAAGVTRRIALTTPHFMAALAVVARTDLVTTISRSFASRFAGSFGLVLQDPPFAQMAMTTTIVWSKVRAADPLLGWVRGVLRQAARSLDDAAMPIIAS
jgi:DNA-binding transcriptional LysR family regulator